MNAKVEAQAREIDELRAQHAAEMAALRQSMEVLIARLAPSPAFAAMH